MANKLSRTFVVSLAIGLLLTPGVSAAAPAEKVRSERGGWFDRMVEAVMSIICLPSDAESAEPGESPPSPEADSGEEGDVGPGLDPWG
ncbi:MAG: hypothetical protein ACREKH_15915 [Candidatus Rokuibacteriota bacterium]